MAYCTLEDLTGTLEVLVFPKVLEAYAQLVEVDKVVLSEEDKYPEETIKFLLKKYQSFPNMRYESFLSKLIQGWVIQRRSMSLEKF